MALASPYRLRAPRTYRGAPALPHPRRLSWWDSLGEWMDAELANGAAEITVLAYAGALVRMFVQLRKGPDELAEADLNLYLRDMAAKGSSREQVKSAAKSYYRWAVATGVHDVDPTVRLRFKAPKYLPAESLSRSEFDAAGSVLRAHRSERRFLAVVLLLETGARIGSMASVRPDEAGIRADALIRFRVAKYDKPYAVPLTEAGAEAVRGLLPGEHGLLIGRSKNTLWAWWHQAAMRAGLPESKWRAHVLRDTFATNLLCSGVDVRTVMELLNHQDLTTMTRYTAVTHRRMREGMAGASVLERFPE